MLVLRLYVKHTGIVDQNMEKFYILYGGSGRLTFFNVKVFFPLKSVIPLSKSTLYLFTAIVPKCSVVWFLKSWQEATQFLSCWTFLTELEQFVRAALFGVNWIFNIHKILMADQSNIFKPWRRSFMFFTMGVEDEDCLIWKYFSSSLKEVN